MNSFLFVNWDVSPEIIKIGSLALRWYGVFFGLSFVIGYSIIARFFKKEKAPEVWLDKIIIYMALGTFLGARLGHCLFYQPDYYLAHPAEIIMIWKGGLASHGAAIGIVISMILASKYVTKRSAYWLMDRIVIAVAFSGLMIRTGNLMNSEILGSETDGSWGIVYQQPNGGDQDAPFFFAKWEDEDLNITYDPKREPNNTLYLGRSIEKGAVATEVAEISLADFQSAGEFSFLDKDLPKKAYWYTIYEGPTRTPIWNIHVVGRHPSQMYEAFAYTLIFLLLIFIYYKQGGRVPYGQLLGLFFILTFGARFLIEFFKIEQVGFEEGMTLNMGQLLSIPLVISGLVFVIRSRGYGKKKMEEELKAGFPKIEEKQK